MAELSSDGIAACYRGLVVLGGAMQEWSGVSQRASVDMWLPDGPIVRIHRFGTTVDVHAFEDAEAFDAWKSVMAGGKATRAFRYVRVCQLPGRSEEAVILQRFEAFGAPAAVDDAMARRIEHLCRTVSGSLRGSLRDHQDVG